MNFQNILYVGSFQNKSICFPSENPLEEVWSRIAQIGVSSIAFNAFRPNPMNNDWANSIDYATTRVQQSVEFREASRHSTLLTNPLTLYYSFLNLKRAALVFVSKKIPPGKQHGLRFKKGTELFNCSAVLCNKGTFIDYLDSLQVAYQPATEFTLDDALSRIIEIAHDYSSSHLFINKSFVVSVDVFAELRGKVYLVFSDYLTNFRTTWQQEFPYLANCCSLEASGNILRLNSDIKTNNYDAISRFCHEKLETNLIFTDSARWHIIRQVTPNKLLPRPAYYYLAIFILGSIARYEPEMMLGVTNPNSRHRWFLKRVISAAERFFPQLILSWIHKQIVFF